ncbi:MAG: hypothetical protein DWQ36_11040 [Acidobacteria bacterium]|nr:MAG: hypothetical protein DWQ30_12360 [Acidobacteriota bacterium]REK07746.1 MAG: hypothetical protein DWQ36_11040 [Acidobacteriota bacterium]
MPTMRRDRSAERRPRSSTSAIDRAATAPVAIAAVWLVLAAVGCVPTQRGRGPHWGDAASVEATNDEVRRERRAYRGAPPVIPHGEHPSPCTACHAGQAVVVAGVGIAPANPHGVVDASSSAAPALSLHQEISGRTRDCRQCHVPRVVESTFVASEFAGLRSPSQRGSRQHPLAPPRIPHPSWMRENCLACHAGPAARPEIATSHPERVVCRQCHVPVDRVLAAERLDTWPGRGAEIAP